MKSPKEEEDAGGLGEVEVGTIVWVRRRNGSWWPGRILGPEELAESHLLSPRTGTPVKLLGREDASVDWYNLEKSKRVKAFRCGEFDACIEKAMAIQGAPTRKREKYARREDAILHALELERKQLAANPQARVFGIDVPSGTSGRNNILSISKSYRPGPYGKYGRKFQLSHRKETHSEEVHAPVSHGNKIKPSKKKAGPHPSTILSENFLQPALPISPKRKFSELSAWDSFYGPFNNQTSEFPHSRFAKGTLSNDGSWRYSLADQIKSLDGSMAPSCISEKLDRSRLLELSRQSSSRLPLSHSCQPISYSGVPSDDGDKDILPVPFHAKKSQCSNVPADSSDTHSNSNFPLAQELSAENSFKIKNYLPCTTSLCEEYTSPMLIEKNESDASEKESSDTETEGEAEHHQNSSQTLSQESDNSNPYALQASEKFNNTETINVHSNLRCYASPLNAEDDPADEYSDPGVSKWHIKGKRNHRSVAKRPMDLADGTSWTYMCNGSSKEAEFRDKADLSNGRPVPTIRPKVEYDFDDERTDFGNQNGSLELSSFLPKKYSSVLKGAGDFRGSYSFSNEYLSDHVKSSPNSDHLLHSGQRAYWEDSACLLKDYSSGCYDCKSGLLIDVDLKVQPAHFQGEHVPMVSLMSRLNGKAIVGHPLQIEILEDGSTDHFVSSDDVSFDHRTGGPPVWRTGRRTVMQRVPRSNPSGPMLDADEGGILHPGMQSQFKRSSNHFNHKVSLAKRSISHARKSVSSKFKKHSSKKGSLSNSKMRALSSISTGKKMGRFGHILDGLIKSEGGIPLVTCVPVKVVFSRILEALGRPSSVALQRVRMASPAVREPT